MEWINARETLPEEKINEVTHDYFVYPVKVEIKDTKSIKFYYFGDGHWWHGPQIMDHYVTHWFDIYKV